MANELPNGGKYPKIGAFKMWCQKVLPLVYDDSLSYYETLCRVVRTLNEVISTTNEALEDVETLITTYADLKQFVNDYLNDLAIQDEIDNKLDRMVTDGTFEKVLTPLLESYFNEFDDKLNKEIGFYTESLEKEKKKFGNFVAEQETKLAKYVNDVDVLRQRLNNLSSMGEGSTTGDAELRDMRVTGFGSTEVSAGEAVRKQFIVLDNGKTDNAMYNLWEHTNVVSTTAIGSEASQVDDSGYITLVSTSEYGALYHYIVNHNPPVKRLLVAVKFEIPADALLPIEVGTICHCVMVDDRENDVFESKSYTFDTIGEHTIVGVIDIDDTYSECYTCGISILLKNVNATVKIKDYVGLDVTNISDDLIKLIDVEQYMADGYFDKMKNVGTATFAEKAVFANSCLDSEYAYTATNAGVAIAKLPVIEDNIVHGFGCIVDTIGGSIRVVSNTSYGSPYMDYDMLLNKRYCAVWQGHKFNYLSLINSSGTGWLHSEVKTVEFNGEEYHYADITVESGYKKNALYWNSVDNMNVTFKPIIITDIPANAIVNDKYVHFLLKGGMVDIVTELNSLQNKWFGKKVLYIGDSLTEANVYQKTVENVLGTVTHNVAIGGSAIQNIVTTVTSKDVKDKDLIVLFVGYNNRHNLVGKVGDSYKSDGSGEKTIAGYMQFAIDTIYNRLEEAGNLTCKLLVVTVDCAGKYEYIDADGYEEYPVGSGQTMETIANIQKAVAQANGLPCCDLWHNSGINKRTWNVYGAKQTAVNELYSPYQLDSTGKRVSDVRITYRHGDSYYQLINGKVTLVQYTGNVPHPYNNDQLHKSSNGYKLIGECIAGAIVSAFGR